MAQSQERIAGRVSAHQGNGHRTCFIQGINTHISLSDHQKDRSNNMLGRRSSLDETQTHEHYDKDVWPAPDPLPSRSATKKKLSSSGIFMFLFLLSRFAWYSSFLGSKSKDTLKKGIVH
jgi:hypothetical protein